MQLTDMHLVLLNAAAQRDDRLLTRPATLRGQAADKLAGRLEAAGLVEGVAVTAGQPVRLRLLRAGLDALGIEVDDPKQQSTATAATVAGAA